MTLQSENIDQVIIALCAVQAELRPAVRKSENPFFHSKYAPLDAVWDVVRVPMAKHGLAVAQHFVITPEGTCALVTTLGHKSGQFIRGYYPVGAKSADPQHVGSAVTYARRYSLSAMLGVVSPEEDDDGNGTMTKASPTVTKASTRPAIISESSGIQEIMESLNAKIVQPTPAEKKEIAERIGDGTDGWFKHVPIPIGKNKGITLGELHRQKGSKSLSWYFENYTANPRFPDSQRFREALDAFRSYLNTQPAVGPYAGNEEPVRIGEHEAF